MPWRPDEFNSDPFESRVSLEELALVLLAVFVALVGLDVFVGIGEPRAVFAFAFFGVIPGALLLTLLGYGPRVELPWLLYAIGVSLLLIMAIGFLLNLLLPEFGVERPIGELSLGIAHGLFVIALAFAARLTDPSVRTISVPDTEAWREWCARWLHPTTLGFLLLPPLTILSVVWLNHTSDNRPLLVVLAILGLVPLVIALKLIGRRWLGISVWTVGVSLPYHDTLWKFSNFGGQTNIIDAWREGRWAITTDPPFAAETSLLPNVTLSPTFAHLGGIEVLTQINVFNPLLASLIPVCAYVIFGRIFDPTDAALGAILITFIHPFYFQVPTMGRAGTPVLFLVLAGVAITDTDLDPVLRKGLALGFVAALATSHYGASYFVMLAFLLAVLLLVGLRFFDTIAFGLTEPQLRRNKDGVRRGWGSVVSTNSYTLSAAFAIFYTVFVYVWYLFTYDGRRVWRFFTRVEASLIDFFTSPATPRGGTTARLTREYGTISIELSRYIYVFLSALIAIGFMYIFIQRFTGQKQVGKDILDEYIVLAGGIIGSFLATFIFSAMWGGGRPMAISFSIIAVLAVIGIYAVVNVLWGSYQTVVPSGTDEVDQKRKRTATRSLFAMIIAILLVLNTGAAAAVVLGGGAPSSVPLQEQIVADADENPTANSNLHFGQDVATYAWINTHGNQSHGIHADLITRTAANDWYGPQVRSAEDPERAVSHSWTNDLFDLPDHEGTSYAVLSGHNTDLGVGIPREGVHHTGARAGEDLSDVEERLSDENRVYTTGNSNIYFTSDDL
ncbi:hypothetical protein CV102_22605 [Natronococcus pandeyae]|uniref:DUF2206 domain-containing protein n=1 Tax=Natronococcus pandeyae TaxID=2055836 RepID=A0A8J8Q2B0_9EURY|nr:DUF2206 domain-containing protein [Natronococcus pandeyae]TYL36419.1 hypothetical protein CV102_22605 [Natronococcus pandeyae]